MHLLSGPVAAASGDGIRPFTSTNQRLHKWALKEDIHQASQEWQHLINQDEPIDGDECVYDQRRLAHLAVKWVVISSFESAERKEHEPIRFSGSQVTMTTQLFFNNTRTTPQQPQQRNNNNTTATSHQANWSALIDDAPDDGTAADMAWTSLLVDYTLSENQTVRT